MTRNGATRRANKARDKIEKMRREWRNWKGEEPKILRVNMADYLALTEVGFIREASKGVMLLSGTSIEVKPG